MTTPYGMLEALGGGQGTGIAQAPNIGLELGQAFQGIGKGVQGIIDPDYDLQKHMQLAIAQNPELGQSLADRAFISDDPKYFSKMGLGGKMETQLRGIQPSPQAIQTKQIQHQIGDAGGDIQKAYSKLDDSDPEKQIWQKLLGFEDPKEYMARKQTEIANATTATNKATVSGVAASAAPGQIEAQGPYDVAGLYDHVATTGQIPEGMMTQAQQERYQPIIDSAKSEYNAKLERQFKGQGQSIQLDRLANGEDQNFMRNHSMLVKAADSYSKSKPLFDQVINAKNPGAVKSAIANMIQTTDSNVNLRQQMFNTMSVIDQGAYAQMENYVHSKATGLPDMGQFKNFQKALTAAVGGMQTQWDNMRAYEYSHRAAGLPKTQGIPDGKTMFSGGYTGGVNENDKETSNAFDN
jgi:hypothetical protein